MDDAPRCEFPTPDGPCPNPADGEIALEAKVDDGAVGIVVLDRRDGCYHHLYAQLSGARSLAAVLDAWPFPLTPGGSDA